MSQRERAGVSTPDGTDLSAGGRTTARGGSGCFKDNQADIKGSSTDTDTREALFIPHARGEGERGCWSLGDKDVGNV